MNSLNVVFLFVLVTIVISCKAQRVATYFPLPGVPLNTGSYLNAPFQCKEKNWPIPYAKPTCFACDDTVTSYIYGYPTKLGVSYYQTCNLIVSEVYFHLTCSETISDSVISRYLIELKQNQWEIISNLDQIKKGGIDGVNFSRKNNCWIHCSVSKDIEDTTKFDISFCAYVRME
jgi:hypothetical protein